MYLNNFSINNEERQVSTPSSKTSKNRMKGINNDKQQNKFNIVMSYLLLDIDVALVILTNVLNEVESIS